MLIYVTCILLNIFIAIMYAFYNEKDNISIGDLLMCLMCISSGPFFFIWFCLGAISEVDLDEIIIYKKQ